MRNLFAVAALMAAVACAGTRARENVLMPVMAQAFDTVIRPNVEKATDVPVVALDRMGEILSERDVSLAVELLTLWTEQVRDAFIDGLNNRLSAGEIGPGVAASLLETAAEFDRNVTRLVTRGSEGL